MYTLQYPWVLLLILLPYVFYYIVKPFYGTNMSGILVPFYDHVKSNIKHKQISLKGFDWWWFLVWIFIVIAIARPVIFSNPIVSYVNSRDIILALDTSDSMSLKDMKIGSSFATRLQVVKKTAKDFVISRTNDRIGLILFGSYAYLQTPITMDKDTLKYMIDDASIGIAGQLTSIGDTIGLAVKKLRSSESKSKVLILLTDGVSNHDSIAPLKAAEIAKEYNIKIYTIGLGSDSYMISNGFLGSTEINPSKDLDETTLKKISEMTGGVFFRTKNTNNLKDVYEEINKMEPTEVAGEIIKPYTDLFYIPLCISFIISIMMFIFTIIRRRIND